MALSEETIAWLNDLFQLWEENGDAAQEKGSVSKKSADFIIEQKKRLDQYGDKMFLSEKQRLWLEDIRENL